MKLNKDTAKLISHMMDVLQHKREFRWWFDKRQYGDNIEWEKLIEALDKYHGIFAEHQSSHLFFVEKLK